MKLYTNQRGAMVLVLMIVVSVVLLVMTLSMGLLAISENQIALDQSRSARMILNAEGCVDEALLNLSRNNDYVGDDITIQSTNCVIVVSGVGETRNVDVLATNDRYTGRIRVDVDLNPFAVTAWSDHMM